jgi:hypothetical protein
LYFPTAVFHTNTLLFKTNSSLLNHFLLPLVMATASILPNPATLYHALALVLHSRPTQATPSSTSDFAAASSSSSAAAVAAAAAAEGVKDAAAPGGGGGGEEESMAEEEEAVVQEAMRIMVLLVTKVNFYINLPI